MTRWLAMSAMVCGVGLAGCNAPPVTVTPAKSDTSYERRERDNRGTGAYTSERERRRDGDRRSEREERPEREQRMPQMQESAGGGGFDFYLLNLSWSPEFCTTHPDRAECALHAGFVLHGLWPQRNDGSYPQHCGDASAGDTSAYAGIWPDPGLLQHEWQTHGTCSGLSADAYFNAAKKAKLEVAIPRELASVRQETMLPPAEILGDFARANPSFPAESFALSCGNNRLTAVEVCMDKNLKAIACQGVRSCRANAVKITPAGN